jgi:hypothetical protein
LVLHVLVDVADDERVADGVARRLKKPRLTFSF